MINDVRLLARVIEEIENQDAVPNIGRRSSWRRGQCDNLICGDDIKARPNASLSQRRRAPSARNFGAKLAVRFPPSGEHELSVQGLKYEMPAVG